MQPPRSEQLQLVAQPSPQGRGKGAGQGLAPSTLSVPVPGESRRLLSWMPWSKSLLPPRARPGEGRTGQPENRPSPTPGGGAPSPAGTLCIILSLGLQEIGSMCAGAAAPPPSLSTREVQGHTLSSPAPPPLPCWGPLWGQLCAHSCAGQCLTSPAGPLGCVAAVGGFWGTQRGSLLRPWLPFPLTEHLAKQTTALSRVREAEKRLGASV